MKRFLIGILLLTLSAFASAATITAVVTITPEANGITVVFLWETMGDADTGTSVTFNQFGDRSVQVIGTFGSATVTIQGSNDGATWETLTDYQGNAVTFTAAGLTPIAEVTRYIRAITSGGTGTDVDVYVFARRN